MPKKTAKANNPGELDLAREFAERVRAKVPGQTRAIILFGSRARGDARADSDYDVLVMVEKKNLALEDEIIEVAAEWMDRYQVFVTPLLCEQKTFSRYRQDGIYREINKEGISL